MNDIGQIVKILKNYYLNDERPLSVGYSGGKDSSVAMDLVFKMLLQVEKPTKKVYVVFSDTKLEMDPVIEIINNSIESIKDFSKKHNLPVHFIRAEPLLKHSFFSLLGGKGYVLPTRNNRWCTNRLKILPSQRVIDEILEKHNGFISVLGSRRAESTDRAQRLKDNTIDGIYKTHDNKSCNILVPIEHFSVDDAWNYIYTKSESWLNSTALGRLYAEASNDGDECRSLLEGSEGEKAGCSQSGRFGCLFCPLFEKDRTLNNLAKHHDYLDEVEEFRNWLQSYQLNNWHMRDVYNHRNHEKKLYDRENHRYGLVMPGGYTLAFRKTILYNLMELEKNVYERRGSYFISDEELAYIQEVWIEEGDVDSLYKIATHRSFEISSNHKKIVEALKVYKSELFVDSDYAKIDWQPPLWKQDSNSVYKNERYYAQISKEILELQMDPEFFAKQYIKGTHDKSFFASLKVNTVQFYPTPEEERYIRSEWKEDKVGFMRIETMFERGVIDKPEKTLVGYDSFFSQQFEVLDDLSEGKNILQDKHISIEEKIAFIESKTSYF